MLAPWLTWWLVALISVLLFEFPQFPSQNPGQSQYFGQPSLPPLFVRHHQWRFHWVSRTGQSCQSCPWFSPRHPGRGPGCWWRRRRRWWSEQRHWASAGRKEGAALVADIPSLDLQLGREGGGWELALVPGRGSEIGNWHFYDLLQKQTSSVEGK